MKARVIEVVDEAWEEGQKVTSLDEAKQRYAELQTQAMTFARSVWQNTDFGFYGTKEGKSVDEDDPNLGDKIWNSFDPNWLKSS